MLTQRRDAVVSHGQWVAVESSNQPAATLGSGGRLGQDAYMQDDSAARPDALQFDRVGELRALYRLTDQLYRARSLDDIYNAALDAIVDTLGCSRASVLLFDDAYVMRFVAWRGLSDDYRKAVEGHSPWQRGHARSRPDPRRRH